MILEVNIAPNISKVLRDGTLVGFRVYVRGVDPRSGKSRKYPKRFGPEMRLEQLIAYRDAGELAETEPDEGGFAADARRYLALEDVQAMPGIKSRTREIEKWIELFGEMPRTAIEKNTINDALHRLRKSGYSNSSCNKFRTALMSLWTVLDGRSAANPVRETVEFDEAPNIPRGQSYELLTRILDAIPDERGVAVDRPTLYRELWSEPATVVAKRYEVSSSFLARLCTRLSVPRPPRGYWTKPAADRPAAPPLRRGINGQSPELLKSRARLEVLAWTGMEPGQLARMTLDDFSFDGEGWYTPPARRKGKRRGRTTRPTVRLPMTPDSREAFRRLVAVDGLGDFNGASLLHTWIRAARRVELELRAEYNDPTFRLPHLNIKTLRHSFGTKVYADTGGDLNTVGRMLTHAPGSRMTIVYSLAAVPEVLRTQMKKFASTRRKSTGKGKGKAVPRGTIVVPFRRNS